MRKVFWMLLGWSGYLMTAPLQLDTHAAPPYQVVLDGRLSGEAVQVLDCALSRLDMAYQVALVPWKRALANVQQQRSDGYFSVMADPAASAFATLSAPLVLEKWYWYGLTPAALQTDNFPAGRRIGALRGSNQANWLQAQGWPPFLLVNQQASLLRLLQIGRIDLILADERSLAAGSDPTQGRLVRRFERYTALGVNWANAFLDRHPDFLSRFNAQLPDCSVPGGQLSAEEQQLLRQQTARDLTHWQAQAVLWQALEQVMAWDPLATTARDDAWQSWQRGGGEPPEWIARLLDSPLSRQLADWQQAQQGRLAELFVTDALGRLVASAQPTSDYWQGDEEKVTALLAQARQQGPGGDPWLERGQQAAPVILYDDSSRHFISHISYPLWQGGRLRGVLVLGVNVEVALQQGTP